MNEALSELVKKARRDRKNLLAVDLLSIIEKEFHNVQDENNFLMLGNTILHLSILVELKSELLLYLFSLQRDKRKKEMSEDTEIMEIFSLIQKSVSKGETFKKPRYVEVIKNDNVPVSRLLKIIQEILEKEKYLEEKKIKGNEISIKEMIETLKIKIKSEKKIVFQKLFENKKSRLEIILMFLALLILAKSKFVRIVQQDVFAPIYVEYRDEKRRIPVSN